MWQFETGSASMRGAGMTQYHKMGDWFVQRGVITQERLDQALKAQRSSKGRMGEILVSMGLVTEEQVVECLSEQYELPIEDMSKLDPDPDIAKTISLSFATTSLVLITSITSQELQCVVSDPIDVRMTDQLNRMFRRKVTMSLAPATKLYQAIVKAYSVQEFTKPPKFDVVEGAKPKSRMKVQMQKDREQLLLLLQEVNGDETIWQKFGAR